MQQQRRRRRRKSNLTFTHVSIDDTNESTPLNDGCDTTIASVAFSATVTQP